MEENDDLTGAKVRFWHEGLGSHMTGVVVEKTCEWWRVLVDPGLEFLRYTDDLTVVRRAAPHGTGDKK